LWVLIATLAVDLLSLVVESISQLHALHMIEIEQVIRVEGKGHQHLQERF
jgi:hypothetical protein